jgi:hypothetical protein
VLERQRAFCNSFAEPFIAVLPSRFHRPIQHELESETPAPRTERIGFRQLFKCNVFSVPIWF